MKVGESRFFLNWQMPTSVSGQLLLANSEAGRKEVCSDWLETTSIPALTSKLSNKAAFQIVEQAMHQTTEFCEKQKFIERKMSCLLEIVLYLFKILIEQRPSENQLYADFQELLLRHAIQRPPVSLAVFSLADVKAIDLFVQDNFFRLFDMYSYALTVKDVLRLTTVTAFKPLEPAAPANLNQASAVPARDLDQVY